MQVRNITNRVESHIAADSPGTGRDRESVGAAPLGKMERYWKLMSDQLEERVREAAVCYCIERAKWSQCDSLSVLSLQRVAERA